MLRIVGQGQNPRSIQKYVTKMFAGIERMRVQEDNTKGVFKSKIQGVISQFGTELEEISFEKETVEIKKDQNVEVWLRKLEESIKKNMQAKLTSYISKFGEQKSNIENRIEGGNKGNNLTDTFREWLRQYPNQLILLGIQIAYRDELERNLDQGKKKQKAKKLMLMINCIKEFKSISKEPELRYRAVQILSTLL